MDARSIVSHIYSGGSWNYYEFNSITNKLGIVLIKWLIFSNFIWFPFCKLEKNILFSSQLKNIKNDK